MAAWGGGVLGAVPAAAAVPAVAGPALRAPAGGSAAMQEPAVGSPPLGWPAGAVPGAPARETARETVGSSTAAATWPLAPPVAVVQRFRPPPRPWLPGHRGVDLAAAPGRVVRASAGGRVVFAGRVAGKPVVSISHGAVRTTYEPVTAMVEAGDPVTAGATIGVLAPSGGHCGRVPTCLHWGLRRGAVYLDPLLLLGAGRVVLKPP
jgi:murein DD-endopeptidase MepM/ murein hydrolase activator NlpD